MSVNSQDFHGLTSGKKKTPLTPTKVALSLKTNSIESTVTYIIFEPSKEVQFLVTARPSLQSEGVTSPP